MKQQHLYQYKYKSEINVYYFLYVLYTLMSILCSRNSKSFHAETIFEIVAHKCSEDTMG